MKYNKGDFAVVPNLSSLTKVSSPAFKLFVYLCKYADESGICFPSRAKLATDLGYGNKRSIDKYVNELCDGGFIVKTKRFRDNGSHTSTRYQICLVSQIDTTHQEGVDTAQVTRGTSDRCLGRHPTGVPLNTPVNTPKNTPPFATDVAGIPDVIKAFEAINPQASKWYANKTQRNACRELIESNGLDSVLNVVNVLATTNNTEYMPIVTTPHQLAIKWSALAAALQRKKNNQPIIF